jgi:hypothetical protein
MISSSVKLWLKEKWVYFLAILPIVAYGLFRMFQKHPNTKVTSTNKAAVDLQRKLGKIRAEAALYIGKARGKEAAVKEEVKKITEMPVSTSDEQKKQLQDLADLLNRIRR